MKKKSSSIVATAEPFKQDPEMRISLPPDSKLKTELKGLMLDKNVSVTIRGKVTGYNMDRYGCGLTVKIDLLSVDDGMGGAIRRMRKEQTY